MPFIDADAQDISGATRIRSDPVDVTIKGMAGLHGTAAAWLPALRELKNLKRLKLYDCSLIGANMEHIAESLSDTPTLVELDFSGNKSLAGSGASWSQLQGLKQLKKLTLDGCGLGVQDVIHIAALPGGIPNLAQCSIDHFFELKRMERGVRMKLSLLSVTGSDAADILKVVSNCNDLVEVVFQDISGLKDTAAEWSHACHGLKHLERCEFQNCSLIGADIEHIAASLSDTTTLVELDLSGNKSLAGSGASWSQLQGLKQLKKLTLDGCRLGVPDVIRIAALAGCIPTLAQCSIYNFFELKRMERGVKMKLSLLSVTGSDAADILKVVGNCNYLVEVVFQDISGLKGTTAEWSHAFHGLKHLERCKFRSCSLIRADIEHIAASLSDTPTLVELDLSGNRSLGGSHALSHLKCLKHLQALTLRSCSLTLQDMASLSDLPTLIKLDLSKNASLAGSGAWSHLKCLKQLKQLVVYSCSLRENDIRHIAASLSCMPNLVELDLSGNYSLGGSGAWTHLKSMKQLKQLILQRCTLSARDIPHIASLLSDMPNLVKLDLSINSVDESETASVQRPNLEILHT
ncbi:leucine-rich repeat-containing protein 31-like [Patiria miniata]|uniref:Uncharacterized protein n=1 Tax=Patiria miniata TaxID=46514 RepID=A0A913ZSR4_PATMI|nr:leucine-rich repeat-containing protein 31-like [Patiria miniata]